MKNSQCNWMYLGGLVTALVIGSQFLLPAERAAAAPVMSAQNAQDKVVNLNRADQAELETIRGIGPVLAQRILDYRKANGNFKQVDDLVAVPGIGPAKFEKIKSQLSI